MKGRKVLFLVFGLFIAINSLISPNRAFASPPQPDGQYDFSTALFNGGLEEISSDWPRIFASGTPYLNKKDSEEKVNLRPVFKTGRVILIPPYALALHHVVDVQVFEDIYMTPYGPGTISTKADGVLEEKYWLQESKNSSKKIPLEKILFLEKYDLALFLMPPDSHKEISYPVFKIGSSKELKLGNVIYLLGSPRLIGVNIRPGIISALDKHFDMEAVSVLQGEFEKWAHGMTIGLSIPAKGGDSGSPVVALRDGKPELVGLLNMSIISNFSTILSIDEVIEKIKKASSINLRLQNAVNLKRIKNNVGPR